MRAENSDRVSVKSVDEVECELTPDNEESVMVCEGSYVAEAEGIDPTLLVTRKWEVRDDSSVKEYTSFKDNKDGFTLHDDMSEWNMKNHRDRDLGEIENTLTEHNLLHDPVVELTEGLEKHRDKINRQAAKSGHYI